MINWERVHNLHDEVGKEDFDEVVELFLEEVEEVVARLKTITDRSRLEADLHFLKGSSLNLGFAEFSGLCNQGELRASKSMADSVDIPSIIDSFEISKVEFFKSSQRP